jgi:hypothetical protein
MSFLPSFLWPCSQLLHSLLKTPNTGDRHVVSIETLALPGMYYVKRARLHSEATVDSKKKKFVKLLSQEKEREPRINETPKRTIATAWSHFVFATSYVYNKHGEQNPKKG